MQEIKNVYVDVYCIRDGMVHIFFCGKYLESDGGITFWILWNCYREKVKII